MRLKYYKHIHLCPPLTSNLKNRHLVTREIFFSTQFFFYQMVECDFNVTCVLAVRFDFHRCLDLIFSIPATHSSIIQCHITEEISPIVIYFYIRSATWDGHTHCFLLANFSFWNICVLVWALPFHSWIDVVDNRQLGQCYASCACYVMGLQFNLLIILRAV